MRLDTRINWHHVAVLFAAVVFGMVLSAWVLW